MPERRASVGFPPSNEFGLCALVLQRRLAVFDGRHNYGFFLAHARKMRNCVLVWQLFLAVFYSVDRSLYFLSICQKDAQESVSPLRGRIKRVWALRIGFATVFGGSLIRVAELWIFEAYARKVHKGRFPPFGFV